MAAKKSTTQTKKKPASSGGKKQSASKANSAQAAQQQKAARNQKIAIILMAGAMIMLALTLIKGESVWAAVHNFIFGVFGVCSFIWPLMLIYIAVMIAKNSPKATTYANVIGSGCFIMFLGGIIHLLAGNSEIGSLGDQISAVWDMRTEITIKSAGFFGALIGGGLDALAGKTAAVVLLVILDLLTLMLTTGMTLMSVMNMVKKPIRKVKNYTDGRIEANLERQRQQQEEDPVPLNLPVKGKRSFKSVDLGPDPTPGFNEIRNDDTILIEELAGNGGQGVSAEENIDNILKKNMSADLSPVKLTPVNPEPVKEKKPKKNKLDVPEPVPAEEKPAEEEKPTYQKPTLDRLTQADNSKAQNYEQEVKQKAQKLNETLESFDVNAKLVDICRGPSVTRYELQPAPGVKISKITSLSDDIALAMAATSVRMEAPIPGKAAIGIEIPNKTRATVSLREILETTQYNTQVSKSKLSVAMGKNITGEA
ncbi:MAG: hypothetical protein IJU45_05500, partial [Clostridia bacterium]|nr:hypothetical protein [Clostridia bacterium]